MKQIRTYMTKLATKYPFVRSISIGKTVEGRDMMVIEIRKAGPGKPIVWIEAGKVKVSHFVA